MNHGYALLALLLPLAATAQPVPCQDGFAGEYACHNVDLLAQPTNESATDIWGWTDPEDGTEYAIIFLAGRTTFFDLSDPTNPLLVARLSPAGGKDGRVFENHLFVVDDDGLPGMLAFDLTRLRAVTNPPATLVADAVYDEITGAHNLSLDLESGFAFPVFARSTTCSGELHIVDVRDPQNPSYAGCFDSPALSGFHDAQCLTYDGPDADYAGRELCIGSAGSTGVLAIVDVTDKTNPILISEAPYPNANYTHQGWLTEDGRYFLLNDEFDEGAFGHNTRTIVFDVEDLDEPEFAFDHFGETTSTDHNLFVKGNYVYQANYSAGFRMLDLTEIDNGALSEAAFFDTTPGDEDYFGTWGVYPFFESGIVIASDELRGLYVLRPTLNATDVSPTEPRGAFELTTYPNPFSSRATIALSVEATQRVRVAVYDVLGREVAVLHDGPLAPGEAQSMTFEGAALPAGAYFVHAEGVTFRSVHPLTIAR